MSCGTGKLNKSQGKGLTGKQKGTIVVIKIHTDRGVSKLRESSDRYDRFLVSGFSIARHIVLKYILILAVMLSFCFR